MWSLLLKSGEWKCNKRAEPLLCHAPNTCAKLVKKSVQITINQRLSIDFDSATFTSINRASLIVVPCGFGLVRRTFSSPQEARLCLGCRRLGNQARPHLDKANMPAKSRFTRLDAFTKTVEDARVRTTSGGIVTIASLLIVFYLVWGEWSDYRRVTVHPELIVDKGRGRK